MPPLRFNTGTIPDCVPMFDSGSSGEPPSGHSPQSQIMYSAGHYLQNTPIPGGFDQYGYGLAGYVGSGACETNHMTGVNDDSTKWNDFVKIVAAPADSSLVGGNWYAADGTELGPDIWGGFVVVLEVYNDPATGDHGGLSKAPYPGFGWYK